MTPATGGWKKLTSLSSEHEADLLAGRLQAAGIKTRTSKAPTDSSGWLTAFGSGGLHDVYVPREKAGAAKQVLAEVGSSSRSGAGRSNRRPIQLVGRGLILISLIGFIANLVWNVLR